MIIAALAVAAALQVGDLVTFTYGTPQPVCGRVKQLQPGPAGEPHAWLVDQANPGRVALVSLADLRPGCTQ